MNSLVIAFAALLAVAQAGIHGISYVAPIAHGEVLQGPGSHAAVIGPDGSHITASEHGGAVIIDGHHGHHGYAAHVAHVAPIVHAPVLAYHGYEHDHEGQYVPSGLEKLYDDGSYKPEYHHEDHYEHYY